MPVILRRGGGLNADRPGLGAALEQSFDAEAAAWWDIGKRLSAQPSAILAHTPACVANASDFGLMLAWTRLVKAWAAENETTVVTCDDPWIFRHLRQLPGVTAERVPPLWRHEASLALRGFVSRCAVALRVAIASLRAPAGGSQSASWLLVYGHPSSAPEGIDGYFGDLMQKLPSLRRILHVDCPPSRARGLGVSLHGFGHPAFALVLPFARWRPGDAGECRWLVRRAAAREGGTGQAAMIRWQIHCQRRFLTRMRPKVVAWPWENHSWERAFVRAARSQGVRTVGYQHSVIGRQMLNYAPKSNPDGLASVPDRVLCSGAATRDQLARWGMPRGRLSIGGALRFQSRAAPSRAPGAPIFVALPFDGATAAEMVGAVRRAATSHSFLIKDHPMTPFAFDDSPGVKRTQTPLKAHKQVSAVVYAATSVGIEAVLAGLPTLRFRPRGRIALDIMPDGITVPAVDCETLAAALDHLPEPATVDATRIFAKVDERAWREALA